MNIRIIVYIIGWIMECEAALMLLPCATAIYYHESSGMAFLYVLLVEGVLGFLMIRKKPKVTTFYAKEGFVAVALCWIALSVFGAAPFVINGDIPNPMNALFETVSGFTTTGASILTDVEALSQTSLMWRSFTHWIGGMGVLVFLLALVPRGSRGSGFTLHILRAESPGPDVGKLVPQIGRTARILYLIYICLTAVDVFLLSFDMPLFDAFCIAFGTAGTGGFAVTNAGLGGYSAYVQWVTTLFMFLFGVNFSCYYLLLRKQPKSVLKDEELRFYFLTVVLAGLTIAITAHPTGGNAEETLRASFFQVASIMSTTGFATADFNLWPSLAKGILVFLTILGASAGSTGGGMKCIRLQLLFKDLRSNLKKMIRPGRVSLVRNNGKPVSEGVLSNLRTYLAAYVLIALVSFLLLTIDGKDLTTSITAMLACFNNVGPGLGEVGPTGNFGSFSVFSKLVLIFDMLAGRLEIFPIIALLSGTTWRHK